MNYNQKLLCNDIKLFSAKYHINKIKYKDIKLLITK